MRLVVASVGKFRGGPLQEMYADYANRLPWPIELKEVEEKKPLKGEKRKTREAELLMGAIPDGAILIALDESGKSMTSPDFAKMLGQYADDGLQNLAFLIGGADGHSQTTLDKADRLLSLGPMTWPHMMVRGLLAEQLYRASSILANHPYHRV
tara:strand:- start:1327 stop:1785 length:459 start_codon:yes stop_codon:yes gene_type:complete